MHDDEIIRKAGLEALEELRRVAVTAGPVFGVESFEEFASDTVESVLQIRRRIDDRTLPTNPAYHRSSIAAAKLLVMANWDPEQTDEFLAIMREPEGRTPARRIRDLAGFLSLLGDDHGFVMGGTPERRVVENETNGDPRGLMDFDDLEASIDARMGDMMTIVLDEVCGAPGPAG